MKLRLNLAIFITIVATTLGASLVVPLLPVYAAELGANGWELGLIFSAFAFSRALALPIVGRLADSWGERGFMLWGLGLYGVVSLGFVWANNVQLIILCRAIHGIGAAMVIPVARAIIGQMTPLGHEGRMMGYFNIAFFSGLAVGPWLGGFFKDHFGINMAFYAMGAISFVGLFFSWMAIPKLGESQAGRTTSPVSYWAMLKHPVLLAVVVFRFGTIIGTGMNWSFLPLYAHDVLKLSSTRIGLLISVTVAVPALIQTYFGKLADRWDRAKMSLMGGLIASFCLVLVPYCRNFESQLTLNCVMGIAFGIYMPPLMAMAVNAGRDTGFMNQVMSLLEMAFSVGMVVGPLLAGQVVEKWGIAAVFDIAGAAGLGACLIFWVLNRRSIKSVS